MSGTLASSFTLVLPSFSNIGSAATISVRWVLVAPLHELMQGQWDFVGMRCTPGNDALELDGIVSDGTDFNQLGQFRKSPTRILRPPGIITAVGYERYDAISGCCMRDPEIIEAAKQRRRGLVRRRKSWAPRIPAGELEGPPARLKKGTVMCWQAGLRRDLGIVPRRPSESRQRILVSLCCEETHHHSECRPSSF
jgi:hypothetical protein